MRGRVLIIAGSDPSGGAGIQADIKTVTALGGYAMTAITALTAQNTTGVYGVHAVPIQFIQQQMRLCIEDIGVDCVKTGMLHSAEVIDAVCDVLDEMAPAAPLVVDPVMVAKGGAALLADEAKATLKRRLALIATVITPNVPEAESLAGMGIHSEVDMVHAATALLTLGAPAVFLKGGHMPGPAVRDLLVAQDDMEWFEQPRIDTVHTHGTGCTLASAIATGLAQGLSLRDAVARAQAYVHAAIAGAPGYGHGHGPIDHGHTVRPFTGG
ncbi:MAG: bifunctional hydroxymethylpyrimidine kinase/phosphomethylpyrimidine kinase [Rhodospirillales bacterium]